MLQRRLAGDHYQTMSFYPALVGSLVGRTPKNFIRRRSLWTPSFTSTPSLPLFKMRVALSLIPLLLLSSSVLFVTAQGNDEFGSITAFFSVPLVYVSFVWDGEAGHHKSRVPIIQLFR
jgi:hypothetical protein